MTETTNNTTTETPPAKAKVEAAQSRRFSRKKPTPPRALTVHDRIKEGGPTGLALGMNFPQVRLLKVLNKSAKGLTRAQLSEKAGVNGGLATAFGPADVGDVAASDKRNGRKSLLGLGYAKLSTDTDEETPTYQITAAGRKALDILSNDMAWPFGH